MDREKGKVLGVITKDGDFVSREEMELYAKQKVDESKKKQKSEDEESTQIEDDWTGRHGVKEKPYPASFFLNYHEHVTIFAATVDQIATDVTGGGYTIEPVDDSVDKDNADFKREKETAKDFFKRQFKPPHTIKRLTKQSLIDRLVIGHRAIEVARNPAGLVTNLYYVPAKTVWVDHRLMRDNDTGEDVRERRYVQKRGRKAVYFKEFGDTRVVSQKDGKVYDELPVDEQANEMIFDWELHPKDEYYGLPKCITALGAMDSLLYARQYNVSFFENHGVPAYVVKLKGAWDDDAAKHMEDFIKKVCHGAGNAQKAILMKMPYDPEAEAAERYGDIVIEEVDTIENKDGGFTVLNRDDRMEVLSSYSMPPYRIGVYETTRVGGDPGTHSSHIYKQSVIDPLTEEIDAQYTMILQDGRGLKNVKFSMNPVDVRDKKFLQEIYTQAIEYGLMTPKHAAERMNYPEPPDHMDQYFVNSRLVPVLGGELGMRSGMTEEEIEDRIAEIDQKLTDMQSNSDGGYLDNNV